MFTDSHIHLAQCPEGYPDLCEAYRLFSCTAKRNEWDVQKAISDNRVVKFYGIHPWYPNEDVSDLRAFLEEDRYACVGEIGLDAAHPDMVRQIGIFTEQVDIASEYGRCISVHIHKTQSEVLSILRKHAKGICPILHSFPGPPGYVKPFTRLDCFFSVSPRMLKWNTERIEELMDSIPENRLLVESDYPTDMNTMNDFLDRLSGIMGIDKKQLISITNDNAREALGWRI